ncbi:MAG: UrcA family protein [Steroidobacteraceae bacterium]
MKMIHTIRWGLPLVVAGLSLAATASAGSRLAPVTMQAAPVVVTELGRSNLGARVEVLTVAGTVSYGDLDLTTRAGAARLIKRLQLAAQSACQRLDGVALMTPLQTRACTRKAEAGAMRQARLAVAVAKVLEKKA